MISEIEELQSSGVDFSQREAWKIARGAASIKRAEMLARSVESSTAGLPREAMNSWQRKNLKAALAPAEASRIRGLLLTVDNFDWRSLALRCVACLYRLESVLKHSTRNELPLIKHSPEVIRNAREGLRVFATLAQQLGLHALKNLIEDRAFRILYQRQYRAASMFYKARSGATSGSIVMDRLSGPIEDTMEAGSAPMEAVSSFLLSHITTTLMEDCDLMEHLDDLKVTARLKEPYSLWRKLLKKSRRIGSSLSSDAEEGSALASFPDFKENGNSLLSQRSTRRGLLHVSPNLIISAYAPDAIAVRVVLRARRWYMDEPEQNIRERERLICYYIQQKLISRWPDSDPGRIKDYIQFPKPNGKSSSAADQLILLDKSTDSSCLLQVTRAFITIRLFPTITE